MYQVQYIKYSGVDMWYHGTSTVLFCKDSF